MLLEQIKIPFNIVVSDIDESKFKIKIKNPFELVKVLAKEKARRALTKLKERGNEGIVIAADTIVEICGNVIGKASDEGEAKRILAELSGKTHKLITGLAICSTNSDRLVIDYATSEVTFLELSSEDIDLYIACGEWKGRAGAYSIRERANLFINSIVGSPTNVLGLPSSLLYRLLKKNFNYNLLEVKL